MVQFTAIILQFARQGEKTGWSYIRISATIAAKLKPGNKKSFRVKGRLDDHAIKGMAVLPMGDGDFIMALNATVRKAIRKNKGASLKVQIEADTVKISPPKDLLVCLADEPRALDRFNSLTLSHRNYFGNWVKAAKTGDTRARRIAQAVNALAKGMDFGQMIRSIKQDRQDRLG
jgi:hypothetical protein